MKSSFYFSEREIDLLIDRASPKCTYCESNSHTIDRCDLFDFHNDMGSFEDEEYRKGREMVLARRKSKHFGGIPELYLKNPTPEQQALIHAHRTEYKRAIDSVIAELVAKRKAKNENVHN